MADTLRRALALFIAVSLYACTTDPKRTALRILTPNKVITQPDKFKNRMVEWGGILIKAHNKRETTELEILAYPLDSDGLPLHNGSPQGRFIAVRAGYLETVEFAPGRLVTVTGPINGFRYGQIEGAKYTYPSINAQQLQLWPREKSGSEPRIHFGIGVGVGF